MAAEDIATPDEAKWDQASAWAPLRDRTFRMLWLVWLTANICAWMNDTTAAWVMTTLTDSPTLVALVQTASSMPVFLLGLPSGAFADILDRRKYFITTQFWVAANAAVLYAVAAAGALTPYVLLALVFSNGIGLAMRWPVFAAIVPELTPRMLLPAALALNGVATNLSRVVGPLVAGAIIASIGSQYVFALNLVLSVGAGLTLFRWRRESKPSVLPGERFLGAMRLGFQYVRESQRMRDAIVRSTAFFINSTAILALLPLVAKQVHGGDARTYAVLLGSMGFGAVLAATQLPRLRSRWTSDQLIVGGSVIHAVSTLAVAISPNPWLAAPAMLLGGSVWITVANSVTIAAQHALPDWVRARGMSIYQMAIMGSFALGALVWGRLAEWTSVSTSLLCAAASMIVCLFFTRGRPLHGVEHVDHTPTRPWEEPVPAHEMDLHEGPVMVTLEYLIEPSRSVEFEAVMAQSRSARLRGGAVSWGLFEDVQIPGRYVEYFACDTWADYLRRFDRFSAMDVKQQEERFAFHIGEHPPKITRYVARHPP
jgi:MFS family permease